MNFFRGLLSVMFLYTVAWSIYQFGYSMGADAETYSRDVARIRLAQCNELISGNK